MREMPALARARASSAPQKRSLAIWLDSVSCFIYRRKTPGPPPSLRSKPYPALSPAYGPLAPSPLPVGSFLGARWGRSRGPLPLPRLQENATLRIPRVNAERKMPLLAQNPSAFTNNRPYTALQVQTRQTTRPAWTPARLHGPRPNTRPPPPTVDVDPSPEPTATPSVRRVSLFSIKYFSFCQVYLAF